MSTCKHKIHSYAQIVWTYCQVGQDFLAGRRRAEVQPTQSLSHSPVVCAWCNGAIKAGNPLLPVSHGLCFADAVRLEAEAIRAEGRAS